MELDQLQIEINGERLIYAFSGLRAEGVFCLGIPVGANASAREKELYEMGHALAVLFGYAAPTNERLRLIFRLDGVEYWLSMEQGERVLRQSGMICSDAAKEQIAKRFARQVMQVDAAKRMLEGRQPFYDPAPVEGFLAVLQQDARFPVSQREKYLRIAAGENRLGMTFLEEIGGRYLENLSFRAGRYFEKLSSYQYRFLQGNQRLSILDLHSGLTVGFAAASGSLQFLAALSVACGMQELEFEAYGLQFPYLLLCDSFDASEIDGAAVRSYFYRLAKRNAG